MMKVKEIRRLIGEWEVKAGKHAAAQQHEHWAVECNGIWVAEFILGDTRKPGYQQPEERIPYRKLDEPQKEGK